MKINRIQLNRIREVLKPNKVVVLLGARRVGKTELLKIIAEESTEKVLFLNGDEWTAHQFFNEQGLESLKKAIGDAGLIIIDEAQEIADIGKKLKIIVDHIPGIKVLISGSSAFEINNQVGEPLVGRMFALNLYPIAQMEFSTIENTIQTREKLEERLIYGGYPELIHLEHLIDKREYLDQLVHSYLLKDILTFEGIKKRSLIMSLLQKIAFRSGSELSLESLGNELQISKNTVEKYLDLFKKVFIIYDVSGFSRNRDNEITKMKKWYFMDNGIRNALISNFAPLHLRTDVGQLWENYINAERKKRNHYSRYYAHEYFWRTHTKQEIDRIEEFDGQLFAFEYKWSESKKSKVPTQFASAYPEASYSVINPSNYLDFIL